MRQGRNSGQAGLNFKAQLMALRIMAVSPLLYQRRTTPRTRGNEVLPDTRLRSFTNQRIKAATGGVEQGAYHMMR
jgi:hypothetical protein